MSVGQDLLDVPFPEMVSKMAIAIAQSQYNLDLNSIEILKIMGNKEVAPVDLPNFEIGDDGVVRDADQSIRTSMVGAGFQPAFYQFAETVIEVRMAITMVRESSYENTTKGTITTRSTSSYGPWYRRRYYSYVRSTPVDAKYASKYNYTSEGSSLLRTRLAPIPPNSFIQRLLDMKAEAMQMEMEVKLKKLELELETRREKLIETNTDE